MFLMDFNAKSVQKKWSDKVNKINKIKTSNIKWNVRASIKYMLMKSYIRLTCDSKENNLFIFNILSCSVRSVVPSNYS